jgi:hypothetical protein
VTHRRHHSGYTAIGPYFVTSCASEPCQHASNARPEARATTTRTRAKYAASSHQTRVDISNPKHASPPRYAQNHRTARGIRISEASHARSVDPSKAPSLFKGCNYDDGAIVTPAPGASVKIVCRVGVPYLNQFESALAFRNSSKLAWEVKYRFVTIVNDWVLSHTSKNLATPGRSSSSALAMRNAFSSRRASEPSDGVAAFSIRSLCSWSLLFKMIWASRFRRCHDNRAVMPVEASPPIIPITPAMIASTCRAVSICESQLLAEDRNGQVPWFPVLAVMGLLPNVQALQTMGQQVVAVLLPPLGLKPVRTTFDTARVRSICVGTNNDIFRENCMRSFYAKTEQQ